MNVGDLVKHVFRKAGDMAALPGANIVCDENSRPVTGIVVGLDEDGDPIVLFNDREEAAAYYKRDVEVISESPRDH